MKLTALGADVGSSFVQTFCRPRNICRPPFLPSRQPQGAELSARAVVGVVCLAASVVIISDDEHLMGDRLGAQCTFASSISTDTYARRSVE